MSANNDFVLLKKGPVPARPVFVAVGTSAKSHGLQGLEGMQNLSKIMAIRDQYEAALKSCGYAVTYDRDQRGSHGEPASESDLAIFRGLQGRTVEVQQGHPVLIFCGNSSDHGACQSGRHEELVHYEPYTEIKVSQNLLWQDDQRARDEWQGKYTQDEIAKWNKYKEREKARRQRKRQRQIEARDKEWQEWESQQAAERRKEASEEVKEGGTLRGVWREDQGREEGRGEGIRLVEAVPRRERKEEPEMGSGEKEHKETVPSRPEDRDQGEPSTREEKEMLEEGPVCRVGQAWEKGELPAMLTILERVQIYAHRGMFRDQPRPAWSAHHYMRLLQFQEFWRRQKIYVETEYEPGKPWTVPRQPQHPLPRAPLGTLGMAPTVQPEQREQEPDLRRPNEPRNPPRFKTETGGVTLREAPPRRSKFPSVMSQLDKIEQNQNKEEDLTAKSRAAQVLREVEEEREKKEIAMKPDEEEGVESAREVRGLRETEEEHERKEIAPKPNEEERVDPPRDARGLREIGPGVFLDNEAKGSMVEMPGEEAESERFTSGDKAVSLGAVITERGRNRQEPMQKKRPAPSPALTLTPVPMPKKKVKTDDGEIKVEIMKNVNPPDTDVHGEEASNVKEKTPKDTGDGSSSKTAEPLHRSPEGELEKKAEGKPQGAPKQRAREVKATEVQPREKRVVDTVDPVPEARKAQKMESKEMEFSTKMTEEKKMNLGSQDEKKSELHGAEEPVGKTKDPDEESKESIEEHVEEQAAKVNVGEQVLKDEELEELLKIVKGPPVFEGMYYYMPEVSRKESFVEYLTNIRDCYLDLRCKPLLDDKILAFAREPPPKGQAGRYIVKYGNLEAVVAVNGEPRYKVFDTREHPYQPVGWTSGVVCVGWTVKNPVIKGFLLFQERKFHNMPVLPFEWRGFTVFYRERRTAVQKKPTPVPENVKKDPEIRVN